MQRLWKVRHAARGRAATATAAALVVALSLVASPALADESFVRNLAQRALERGIAQEARGDIAQALTSYDEAVRTDVTLGAAALRLGALRERMGDREEAELLYSHAVSSPDSSADAYYARALLRSVTQRRAEAMADLAESVAQSPRPERLRVLGGWYVEGRLWSAALSVWRALLADATLRGDEAHLREAEVTVAALSWLASDTDAVLAGKSSPDWARRSLSRAARPARRAPQGVRKLTP
ncbi:MAG: tetratricopeptide repeat protein [Myxococcales bacterium]|nr:MAG: tetratricopeptide repeat protein [Myxococcales bacterium]